MIRRMDAFRPAVAPELLESCNFFELYPFDGGGSFIQQELLGSTDDGRIEEAILNRNALADFGAFPQIDFLKFERWSTIEKSCWINRLYFLVPLARRARLTKNAELAGKLRYIMLDFLKTYPPPATGDAARKLQADVLYARDHDYNTKGFGFDAPIPYQWFDFQPASRLVNLTHALWFLRDFPVFTSEDREALDHLLYLHAQNIYWTENEGTLHPGNHQALRSMALLLASAYFKDLPEAAEWRKLAVKMCEFHILNDFLPDGMLEDLSPSYHFFETWITRDMLLIAEHEGIAFAPAVRERAEKAFAVCHAFRQPDGTCPAINDAYSMEIDHFLAAMPPLSAPVPEEFLLPAAKIAMWRKKPWFLILDDTPLLHPFAHYHGGKQALTLFADGVPFLTDSGCCSYDDPDFSEHYKQPFSHSSLLIDGKGDGDLEGRYHWSIAAECDLGKWQDGKIVSTQTSPVSAWKGVRWQRILDVSEKRIVLEDSVTSPRPIEMTFLWNLHPDVTVKKDGHSALLTHQGKRLRMNFSCDFTVEAGMGFQNFTKVPCRKIVFKGNGAGGSFRTEICFE